MTDIGLERHARCGFVACIGLMGAMLPGGCVGSDDGSGGEAPADVATSTGEEGDAADNGDATGNGDSEAMGCEAPLGADACAALTVCDVFDCGGKAAPYNHFGCPRTACATDDECGADERCFAVALETGCRAETGPCADEAGACVCEGAESCEGVSESHCLPVGFYPATEDCIVDGLDCDALALRRTGLEAALAVHEAAGHTQLAAELTTCGQRLASAAAECPEQTAP